MNYKCLFFALLCIGATCMGSAQDVQSPLDEKGICDLLRKWLSGFESSEDENDPRDVLFFDINHDGIPEALVSFRMDKSPSSGGCHGNGWYLFRFENGDWNQSPFKMIDENTGDPSNDVFARGDDFYSLKKDGEKPKLVLIYESDMKEDYGRSFSYEAREITIDGDGYLKTIPIPELTGETYAKSEGWGEGEGPSCPEDTLPRPGGIEMKKLLVPLSIESYYPPQEKSETENAQPVATAEEKKSEIRKEESGIKAPAATVAGNEPEQQKVTNRLWLYLALALGVLCAVFYFLRRKRP